MHTPFGNSYSAMKWLSIIEKCQTSLVIRVGWIVDSIVDGLMDICDVLVDMDDVDRVNTYCIDVYII